MTLSSQVASRLMLEVRDLVKNSPDGVEYYDSSDEIGDSGDGLSEIHAILHGPEGTPFAGGRFHVKLQISAEYPAAPPKGLFLTKIFHPNVSPSGDICVNTLKKDWTVAMTLKHVLQVVRCLLIVPFPESALNDEAGRLFMDSYDEYYRRARLMTDLHAMPKTTGATLGTVDNASTGNDNNTVDDDEELELAVVTKKKKDSKKSSLKRL